MRLPFSLPLLCALVACLITSLAAQEREVKQPRPAEVGVINDVDVTVTDITEEKLNNPPKREIKLERATVKVARKLPKPDPKLLEQKYAASFRLAITASGRNFRNALSRDEEVAQLQYIGDSPLLFPQDSSSGMPGVPGGPYGGNPGMPGRSTRSIEDSIRRMTKFLPGGETLAKEELDFFANPEKLGGMLSISSYVDNRERANVRYWVFSVLGTTPEEAEKRAKALLLLLDQGAFRPIQLEIFKRREPLCAQLREQRRDIEKAQRIANVAQDELKSYLDFTPDMLSNLRVQQLQLDVDLAGVKARIAACERLLAQPALKADRRNQVEDLKVAAEIEFSGFEARLAKSNEFIGKVKTKIDLLSKLSSAESSQTLDRESSQILEREIRNIDAAIHAYAPLPLFDNQIGTYPIEWTQ